MNGLFVGLFVSIALGANQGLGRLFLIDPPRSDGRTKTPYDRDMRNENGSKNSRHKSILMEREREIERRVRTVSQEGSYKGHLKVKKGPPKDFEKKAQMVWRH